MSLDAIERAVQPDKVLLPARKSRRPSSPNLRFHEPTAMGSLRATCRPEGGDMQAVDRAFAKTRWEPCRQCYGGAQ